jgi:hypothetical protein
VEWSEPPVIPYVTLPAAPQLPQAVLEVPRAQLPSYKPLVVPPNTLRPPAGIQGINTEDKPPQPSPTQVTTPTPIPQQPKIDLPPEAQIVEIPFTDIEVPLPTTTIMTTAATTAFISVGATLTATSLFKYLVSAFKPLFKFTWNKITKTKNKDSSNSSFSFGQPDSSQHHTQD